MVRILVFLLVLFGLWMPKQVFAAEQTVKVMTWNIGGWYSMPAEDRIVRMKKLASVIISHKIEIAYLQEFNDLAKTPDLEILLAELRALGYPMYSEAQTYTGDDQKIQVMVLLSKYPLDKSSKQSTQIRGNRSALSIIVRDTPIGWVRLSNLHTHNTEPCNNFRSYLNFFMQHDSARSLIGGDTNLALVHKPIMNTRNGDSCASIDWDQVTISCVDAVNCLANKRPDPAIIDWFFVFKESELYIQSSYNIGNVHGISDQHPAVVAVIGTNKPTTPVKQGDLDGDGDVDVFDYNILMSVFGKTGAPGFHPADIITDGVIDLFDYNVLMRNVE